MNPLTQQQINQYQWHVADGMARVSDESLHYVYSTTKRHEVERYLLYTNAPNGTYSGDAFELMWQYYDDNDGWNEWLISTQPERDRANGYQLRLFLRLKPLHLPAILTTQPGEEWKDRYEEVWMFQFTDDYGYDLWEQIRVDYSETNYDELVKMYAKNNVSVKREWHLITPPAEQEAETVELSELEIIKSINTIVYETNLSMGYNELLYVVPYRNNDYLIIGIKGKTESKVGELMKIFNHEVKYLVESEYKLHDSPLWNEAFVGFIARTQYTQLQSALTQKDQRIAELEREAEQLKDKLIEINNLCGTINFSSHNQMREAIEGAVELSELPTPPQH
jgi:hypothetical protein